MKKKMTEENLGLVANEKCGGVEHGIEQKANRHADIDLYKRRWWILFVYFFVSVVQGILWNTWAPMTDAAVVAFGWSEGQVAAIPAVANLSFILLAFPILYLIETYGKPAHCFN